MKYRFTVQFRGNIDMESESALQSQIQSVLATFPDFKLTFSSVETWQDADGNPRVFNDDGTDYVETTSESVS